MENSSKNLFRKTNAALRQNHRNQEAVMRNAGLNTNNGQGNPHAQQSTNPMPHSSSSFSSGNKVLKFIPLGGLGEVGKNMNILEYGDDAIVLDAGFALGVDLPGINYAIPELTYLDSIKHKIRAYVFTHGHLDHVGAMPYALPVVSAPCYGSHFTLGMLEKQLEDPELARLLQKRPLSPDNHEKVTIGPFTIELVRVTHSIPDACAVVIGTPVGKLVHTGDFKLDPTPLDGRMADLKRFEELGREGVLLLFSDSTNCERPGRTPTEQELSPTYDNILRKCMGRTIFSAVSTNLNRIQLIIDAAVKNGRKVAMDGRSMLANVELAVKLGYIRIPKGTIVAMRDIGKIADRDLAIVSTGHQGEVNSVLMRMATGEHKYVKLKPSDTVILSASPIPGNEKAVVAVVDRLMREGANVYQHVTRDLDLLGPLHVSGHGNREELSDMIKLIKPKFFVPIHGEYHMQIRHRELAQANGIPRDNVAVLDNGDILSIQPNSIQKTNRVPAGMQLIDSTGAVVPDLVIKDRLLMSEDGIVVTVLTVARKTGQLLTSPDIITRGFIYMRDNEELMNDLRIQMRRFTIRRFTKVELNKFKQELRDDITNFLYRRLGRTPIVIPVVNSIGAQPVNDRPNVQGIESNKTATTPFSKKTIF
jgi:ribonuclease J